MMFKSSTAATRRIEPLRHQWLSEQHDDSDEGTGDICEDDTSSDEDGVKVYRSAFSQPRPSSQVKRRRMKMNGQLHSLPTASPVQLVQLPITHVSRSLLSHSHAAAFSGTHSIFEEFIKPKPNSSPKSRSRPSFIDFKKSYTPKADKLEIERHFGMFSSSPTYPFMPEGHPFLAEETDNAAGETMDDLLGDGDLNDVFQILEEDSEATVTPIQTENEQLPEAQAAVKHDHEEVLSPADSHFTTANDTDDVANGDVEDNISNTNDETDGRKGKGTSNGVVRERKRGRIYQDAKEKPRRSARRQDKTSIPNKGTAKVVKKLPTRVSKRLGAAPKELVGNQRGSRSCNKITARAAVLQAKETRRKAASGQRAQLRSDSALRNWEGEKIKGTGRFGWVVIVTDETDEEAYEKRRG